MLHNKVRQIARNEDWHQWRLTAIDSMMQLTRFTRSLSGSYKMTNGSCVHKLLFKNGRTSHKKIVVCGRKQWVNRIHSRWARQERQWRMNSMRSSAMSDVYIVLFTLLVHFWLVICKSDPHWLFAKRPSFVLPLTCPLVEYFTSPTPNSCLIRVVCFLSRV